MSNDDTKYRVRIVIYDEQSSTASDPLTWTDEPLYSGGGADEMARQAYRTHRTFTSKLTQTQSV